jgi:flagellar biosynthesis/type III secretory pathway protein FliH
MSFYKVIDNDKITWNQKDSAKLDYRMIFEDHDAEKEKKIKEQKKAEIREILKENDAEWESELKKASEKAYQKGLSQGLEQGYQDAQKEIDEKFKSLEKAFTSAYEEWSQRQKELEPGLLDTAFYLAEKIVGIPIENDQIRIRMEKELSGLLRKLDTESRPTILVSKCDYDFAEKLIKKNNPETLVHLGVSDECNPGEFVFETEREMVVQKFRLILNEFRKNLTSLPTWK